MILLSKLNLSIMDVSKNKAKCLLFKVIIFLLLVYLVLINNFIYSQTGAEWVNHTSYEIINSIADDNTYLWLGTSGGVVKFNKSTKEKFYYNKANSNLPDNNINALILDDKANLLCATNKKLVKYDGVNWTEFLPSPNIINPGFTSIIIDNKKNIWIGSKIHGLFKFNGTEWFNYKPIDGGLKSNMIEVLSADKSGNIWIGSSGNLSVNGQLAKFDGINWEEITSIIPGQIIMQIHAICIDSNSNVCVGYDGGYGQYDGKNWINFNLWNVSSIAVDKNNIKWFTNVSGLYTYDDEKLNFISNDLFYEKEVLTLTIDGENVKWFGTTDGLLNFNGIEWNHNLLSYTKMRRNESYALSFDKNEALWIGTIDGLVIYKNGEWQYYNSENSGLIQTSIMSLEVDSSNNIWIGTCCDGVVKYDGNTWSIYLDSMNNGLANGVQVLKLNIDGSLYLGTYGNGLYKYDGSNFFHYTKTNSLLPDNFIRAIEIEKNGKIWVGTDDGLLKIEGENWTVYNSTNSGLSNYGIWSIAIDYMGNKWIGTANDGLYKFDNTQWTHFTTANSELPDGTIYALITEPNGTLWIGTRFGGLASLKENIWKNFNEDNSPLPDNEIRSLRLDKNGSLWIATMNGLAMYKNGVVSVKDGYVNNRIPIDVLYQNFPNPFNQTTEISFNILAEGFVQLKVYNIVGTEICTLVNKELPVGIYTINFNSYNLGSGVYLCVLNTGKSIQTRKMILLK